MNRLIAVARLQLIAPTFQLAMPWLILAASLVVSILAPSVSDDRDLAHYGAGGLVLFYFAFCVVYVQVVATLLPYAMGLSLTRRTFYLGTVLFAALQSLIYGVLFYLLLLVERGTDGWGVRQPFFSGGWYVPGDSWVVDNPAEQVAIFAVPMFVLALLGMLIGVVYRRFGPRGVFVMLTLSVVGTSGGIAGLILWLKDSYFAFFTEQSAFVLFASWPLVLCVVFALAGYVGIRRVVP
ncbi:hypothetical protein BH24ACT9_BH24ACT9_03770 [soil metagenome]